MLCTGISKVPTFQQRFVINCRLALNFNWALTDFSSVMSASYSPGFVCNFLASRGQHVRLVATEDVPMEDVPITERLLHGTSVSSAPRKSLLRPQHPVTSVPTVPVTVCAVSGGGTLAQAHAPSKPYSPQTNTKKSVRRHSSRSNIVICTAPQGERFDTHDHQHKGP